MVIKIRNITIGAIIALISIVGLSSQELSVPLKKLTVLEEEKDLLSPGNAKFVKDPEQKKKREELSKGQHPKTIVVACSDSRVSPEIIFDKGLGELFVVRTAGNVVDSVALGSIEYAAEHLHAPNLLVLGHTKCGAVTAACSGHSESPYINSILALIEPAVEKAKHEHKAGDELISTATVENVENQIKFIMTSKIIKELVEEKKLTIKAAVYDIKTGRIEYISVKAE